MTKEKMVELLIAIRETCYEENIVIFDQEPEFYGHLTALILRLSK